MIYFTYYFREPPSSVIQTCLLLAVRGKLTHTESHRIRRHIHATWGKDDPRMAGTTYDNKRRNKRDFFTLHPRYDDIAKLAEHRFPMLRGRIVRYGRMDFMSLSYVNANLSKAADHVILLDTRKTWKIDQWKKRLRSEANL